MQIDILGQPECVENARGLTVIIDAFKAFTVECFLANMGVEKIIPMGLLNVFYF